LDKRCAVNEVLARKAIRPMRGGSQAHLVLTDGGYFVTKWKENPQHRRVLINEAIGSQLLALMDIATPDWATVLINERFIAANPSVRISLQTGSIPITRGRHFGSKVMINPEVASVHDLLPCQLFGRVGNLDDFLKVLVFDLWVDNNDGRQAVFVKATRSRIKDGQFAVQMIDHGFAFGFDGREWRMRDRVAGKVYPMLAHLYQRGDAAETFAITIAAAQSISRSDFDTIMNSLPTEWLAEDREAIQKVFNELLRRAARLPDLVAQALDFIRKPSA
jgi:hypothetical protein